MKISKNILIALWVLNGRAKRLRDLKGKYYKFDMHGLCSYAKKEENKIYDMKNKALILLAPFAKKTEWHEVNGKIMQALYFSEDGFSCSFHRFYEVPENVEVAEGKEIEEIPARKLEKMKIKDALAIIKDFLKINWKDEFQNELEKCEKGKSSTPARRNYDYDFGSSGSGGFYFYDDDDEEDYEYYRF